MSEVHPTDVDNYPQMWEYSWSSGNTYWDLAKCHPYLIKFIGSDDSDKAGVPRSGRAFVPGCGQGYDVDLFARRGLDSIGLDIAETGVKIANKWLASQANAQRKGSAEVVLGDFFEYRPQEKFDLIYDYTFLCALPPTLRGDWGKRMTALSKPGPSTRLVTLMYPLLGNPPPFGPPFLLSEEVYDAVLGSEWEIVWQQEVPEEMKRQNVRPGSEKLTVWKRK